MSLWNVLVRTEDVTLPVLLRIGLAVVIFPHGAQKALGWFGGPGLTGTIATFRSFGLPAGITLLIIAAEFLGPIILVAGLLSRAAAFGIGCVMLGAILLVHRPNGFFMNWFGTQAGEGYEYHLLVLVIAIAVVLVGSGAWSVDRLLAR